MKKILIALLILSSCAVVHQPPKCELIQRGQPCLTNHVCCGTIYSNYDHKLRWNWWYWNKPVNNYVIIKPNNKPNKPNKPNNRPHRPHRKHRK